MDKELCRTCIHSMYLGWGNMGAMLGCNHIGDTGISQMLLNEGLQPGEQCRIDCHTYHHQKCLKSKCK